MLKFIKMKYYEAYQLYFSVSFVVVVVFTEMWEYLGFALVYVLNFWSAPVTTRARKSCSRYERKRQTTWFLHGVLNLLIWLSFEPFR